jgi:hypothetical protein
VLEGLKVDPFAGLAGHDTPRAIAARRIVARAASGLRETKFSGFLG